MGTENRFTFTKGRLETLAAPSAGRVYHYDEKTPGLAVCVTSTGSRTFYLYKKVNRRPTRVRLGPFPAITIDQARKLAAGLNVAIAAGHDPQEAKRARRTEATLGELWTAWLAHAKGRKRPRSVAEDERNWKLHLQPWAGRRLSAIRRQDVAALHAKLGADHPHRGNRVLALLRAMYNKAEDIGWNGDNPAAKIRPFPEAPRETFLTAEQLPRFWAALADEPNPVLQGFFSLAILTGARRANLQAMRWEDLSFAPPLWRIAGEQAKGGQPITVPLVPLAVEILRRLRGLVPVESEWVFPGRRGGHLTTPGIAWRRLCKRGHLDGLRLHDLRRSTASWMAMGGTGLPIIGKLLGHRQPQTTAIYSRLETNSIRLALIQATDAMIQAGGVKEGNGNG